MTGARAPLTQVEERVYHFLLDFLAEHTFQPSVREIMQEFGIASTKSVADLLASLEKKGYVQREHGRSRGVTLVGFAGAVGTMPVPVVRVTAGNFAFTVEEHLTLDRRLVPSADAFLVRAYPHGAPAHGVRENDLILVHPLARSRDGDVAVIRVGGAVLVRTLQRRGAALVLDAPGEGEDLEVGPEDDYAVLGVLAGVIRQATEPTEPG